MFVIKNISFIFLDKHCAYTFLFFQKRKGQGCFVLKEFEVRGEYREKKIWQKFLMQITAENANYAAEKAFCIIGSKHKKQRRMIAIKEVREKK